MIDEIEPKVFKRSEKEINLEEQQREIISLKRQLSQVKYDNTELKTHIEILKEQLMGREGKYAELYVANFMMDFEERYKEELQPFIELLTNSDKSHIIGEVHKAIEIKSQEVIREFIETQYDKIIADFEGMFLDAMNRFITKGNIDASIRKYVSNKVSKIMERYKNDKLDEMLEMVYKKIGKKYNIQLSKDIVKEMREMQTIQLQTVADCMKKIEIKEQKYLLEEKKNPLMIGNQNEQD